MLDYITRNHRMIRVGSRGSRLAVRQSEIVMNKIESAVPEIRTGLITMTTTGDRIQDKTLDKIGGKGLFVRELDEALRDGRVDITVHSLKDLPKDIPEDLPLIAVTEREDPRDVLILPQGACEIDMSLPAGTSSLRRSLQIRELYPGITTAPVRGNVETRLRKLDEGQYSALIMAAAGIRRLGLEHRISRYFSCDEMIPAAGQGIIGIQARRSDDNRWLEAVNDRDVMLCAMAERAFVRTAGADCGSPDTAFSWIEDGVIYITGLRYDTTGQRIIRDRISGPAAMAEQLGQELDRRLMQK